jgi:hypothetical protein
LEVNEEGAINWNKLFAYFLDAGEEDRERNACLRLLRDRPKWIAVFSSWWKYNINGKVESVFLFTGLLEEVARESKE